MRVFEHYNTHADDVCPICKTKNDEPVVLVGIHGTKDGNKIQAMQVHVGCLELTTFTDNGRRYFVQVVEE